MKLNTADTNSQDVTIKRKNLVFPWKNKEEFHSVYEGLFGESANNETKQAACKRILIWRSRRLNFTPAAVLGTLVLVEVQLRDDTSITDRALLSDLQTMYSSALTRFFNYVSSTVQTKNMVSMYETAQQLGLETFVVDLRHLCAHGQNLPSISTFRRTCEYCVRWLKGYYWDRELENMKDCDATDLRQKEFSEFQRNISDLFSVYDVALKGVAKGAVDLINAKNILSSVEFKVIQTYAKSVKETEIRKLLSLCCRDICTLARRESSLQDFSEVFISSLLTMKSFFELPAGGCEEDKHAVLIQSNRQLFCNIAALGLLENFFHTLVEICENQHEELAKRKGASFWARQVVSGFIAFKQFKTLYKVEKEKNPQIYLDLNTINTETVHKDVLKLYSKLDIDTQKTLIFGDSFRRPWSLDLDRPYIEERIENINEFTGDLLKTSLQLLSPPLSEKERDDLQLLIDTYVQVSQKDGKIADNIQPHSLADILKEQKADDVDVEMLKLDADDGRGKTKQYGIWSIDPDDQGWSSCPIGRLPWA